MPLMSTPRLLLTRVVVAALAVVAVAACSDDESSDSRPTSTAESTAAATAVATSAPPEVEWGDCGITVPAGVEMECGVLEVPANRQDPATGNIRLHFGVVRSQAPQVAEDPIVFLSGGPGQGALGLVPLAYGQLYAPLVGNRDLVIVDQRGTGLSEPSLSCGEYVTWVKESLGDDRPPEEMAAEARQVLDQCRQRLAADRVDFSVYNSAASAADLDDLRRALGYEQWNLYGMSYGTRLALTAMRDHPEGIRSAVLDVAYPVEADLYEETPANAARAIEALFATCESDAGCNGRFPNLRQTFSDLVADLNTEPVTINVVDPQTARWVESELSGDGLVGFLFQSLYATELLPFLPEIIVEGSRGNFGVIGLLQGAFAAQLDFVSTGMYLATQCHEEVPFSEADAVAAAIAEHSLVGGFFEHSPTLGNSIFELCAGWGAGEADALEDQAVTSDIPALILAGQLDPITPPRWGEAIAAALPNSHFFIFPYTGHGAVSSQECAAGMMLAFLDDPASAPASDCIGEIEAPPFTVEGLEVELVAFENAQFSGLRPEGWDEPLPGVYQESAFVALTQVAGPGMPAALLLAQAAGQLGLEAPPQPVSERQTSELTWQLYEVQAHGQFVDLALAEHEGRLFLVQFGTTPMRRDAYYEAVFLPVVDALTPKSP